MANGETVNASPTKRFFISVLIKDITFLDAIVELVDNSVDSARSESGTVNINTKHIEIEYDRTHLLVKDNAAGISISAARDFVFRFGRAEGAPSVPGSVGEFGVGMKRALFKIGRYFEVESWTKDEHLKVEVDVDRWESEPEKDPTDWTFPLVVAEKNTDQHPPGTHITVKRLGEYSVEQLSGDNFGTVLMVNLKYKHTESLNAGLQITINSQNVGAEADTLLLSDEIKPISYTQQMRIDNKAVEVKIVVGAGDPELAKAGWYVFCNGRQIEKAEKTQKTGWNTALGEDEKTPKPHWQFRRFRGYLFFKSDQPDALPWNTTKTGLDVEAPAYRKVRTEMLGAMRQVIDFLNQVDAESDSEGDRPLSSALDSAQRTIIVALPENRNFTFRPSPNRPEKKMRISYVVPSGIGQTVKESLGAGSNKEVGERTFDYYVRGEGLE
jgi:hypothetical protein